VILDDAEALFLSRQQSIASNDPTDIVRVATTLFQGLDDLRFEPVILYATLNIQGIVDEAIESRCDYILTFGLPPYEARLSILQTKVKGSAGERVLTELAAATEGWSGRDLNKINLKAFLKGTAATREELTEEDYLRAVGLTPGTKFSQALQEAVKEEVNHELKEEEPWTNSGKSSTNGFQAEALPRKRRWSFAWRRYKPQPTS
jgi:AAA+ superfamily predicted ATPase